MATNLPTVGDVGEQGAMIPPADAFALLSKPTLELTHEDMLAIAKDLRAKRVRFLQGQPDKTTAARRAPAAPKEKPTAESKALKTAAVADLLAGIKL